MFAFAVPVVASETVVEDARVEPAAVADGDFFGLSLDVGGGLIGVGAPFADANGINTGEVYLLDPADFSVVGSVAAPGSNSDINDTFGFSVALGGDTFAVGAPNAGGGLTDTGLVFLFDSTDLAVTPGVLTPPANVAPGDRFGHAIATDGTRLVVSAPLVSATTPGGTVSDLGIVQVYSLTSATTAATLGSGSLLVPPTIASGQDFGTALAVDSARIAAGAPGESSDTGAVAIHQFTADFPLEQVLTASDGASGDRFGEALTMDGDLVVVGAPGGDAVYVFEFDSGTSAFVERAVISAPAGLDSFGGSVDLTTTPDGPLLIVGADTTSTLAGSAAIFLLADPAAPVHLYTCEAGDPSVGDQLGVAVAWSGAAALATAPFDEPASQSASANRGAVYVYDQTLDCDGNGVLDQVELLDPSNDCNDNDQLDVCEIQDSLEVDIVVVLDTSGSVANEASAVCGSLADIVSEVTAAGFDPELTVLGIRIDGTFSCIDDYIDAQLGTEVPGGGTLNDRQDWGDGTAIVADRFPWRGDSRFVIVFTDESAQDGNDFATCDSADDDAVDNAWMVSMANGVNVITVATPGTVSCVEDELTELAGFTGGTFFDDIPTAPDLAQSVVDLLPTPMELVDANRNGVIDECEGGTCFYDTNDDGNVDIVDFGVFGAAFGTASGDPEYDANLDVNSDGLIDIIDFGQFGAEFGRTDC